MTSILFSYFSVVRQKGFAFLRHQKEVWKKNYVVFPLIRFWRQGSSLCFLELLNDAISTLIILEIHKNNIGTLGIFSKQYYKIILFKKFLSNANDIFRELLPNSTDFFQKNCTRQYLFLFHMWNYSKSLLTVISSNSTFRTVFDLKKLANVLLRYLSVFVMITSICLCQISLVNQKGNLKKKTQIRLFNFMPRIVACNCITWSSTLKSRTVT